MTTTTTTTKRTVKACDLLEIIEDSEKLGYAEELIEYVEYGGYISDAVHEIADRNTSIYSKDILDFIGNNLESLAEVIDEGLYDPSHNYNLYEHGQAAEYMTIDREIYENLETALEYSALYYTAKHYADKEVTEDFVKHIRDFCSDAWNIDRFDEITDEVDEYFADEQEAITA